MLNGVKVNLNHVIIIFTVLSMLVGVIYAFERRVDSKIERHPRVLITSKCVEDIKDDVKEIRRDIREIKQHLMEE